MADLGFHHRLFGAASVEPTLVLSDLRWTACPNPFSRETRIAASGAGWEPGIAIDVLDVGDVGSPP
jgi:hypothetical protein